MTYRTMLLRHPLVALHPSLQFEFFFQPLVVEELLNDVLLVFFHGRTCCEVCRQRLLDIHQYVLIIYIEERPRGFV